MTCQNLNNAKTVGDVSGYVQTYARYCKDAPASAKYSARYPHRFGTRSVFSYDTWDLVVQLCRIYGIKVKG